VQKIKNPTHIAGSILKKHFLVKCGRIYLNVKIIFDGREKKAISLPLIHERRRR
jgi:hypothetical protein